MGIDVRDIADDDRRWVRDLLTSTWGLPVVTPTGAYDAPEQLSGCVEGERVGVVLWDDVYGGRQVVVLHTEVQRAGVGWALMSSARAAAWTAGIDRLWLVTTDDNPTALAFYAAIGMAEVRRLPGFIDVTRAAKPELPADAFGDAIEFAWDLGRLRQAIAENVALCDGVARGAGVGTSTDADRWWATSRTPPLHPDAITLRPGVGPDVLLAGTDAGPGCSVKDSFADVDLGGLGFEVLFDATWFELDGVLDYEPEVPRGAVPLGPLRVWVRPD